MKRFKYPIKGLIYAVGHHRNFKIHLAISMAVLIFAALLDLNVVEFLILLFAIGLVWVTELFNTAIEEFANAHAKGELREDIRIVKDVSAAAVFVSSVTALAVGVLIFWNRLGG